jgi:hypothetical protein
MKYFFAVLLFVLSAIGVYFYLMKDDKKPARSFVPSEVKFNFPSGLLDVPLTPTKIMLASPLPSPSPSPVRALKAVVVEPEPEAQIAPPVFEQPDLSFLRFTQKLEEHLVNGLSVSELERLYQQGKAQDWPIDWIFAPVVNKGPFKIAYDLNEVASLTRFGLRFSHNFFTVSSAPQNPSSDNRKTQVSRFQAMLLNCNLCNQNMHKLIDLPTLRDINSDLTFFSEHKLGQAVASVYRLQRPQAYNFGETEYQQLDADISFLLKSNNEYLRQHGQFSQMLRTGDSQGLMASLSEMTSMSSASLIQFIKFSQPLTQAQSYQIMYKRFNNTEQPQEIDRLLDFVMYHGQYFSIREAIELLNVVTEVPNPLINEIRATFKRAQDKGFDTVAQKWLQARAQNPIVFEGILGRKGGEFYVEKAKSNFILQMMATQNIEKMQKKWQREFSDTDLASTLFSQMNWPSLLEGISLNSVPGSSWNNNVIALTNAKIEHNFDTLSTLHLRLIQRLFYDTVANTNQLEELRYLYPMLLPSEQEWIGRSLDSEDKSYVMGE